VSQDGLCQAAANEAGTADSANMQNGNILSDRVNVKRSLVNSCVNINLNEQVKIERCEGCLPTVVSQNEIHDIVLKMT
jgi:hypothetical protein